jgi:hypothetical protein
VAGVRAGLGGPAVGGGSRGRMPRHSSTRLRPCSSTSRAWRARIRTRRWSRTRGRASGSSGSEGDQGRSGLIAVTPSPTYSLPTLQSWRRLSFDRSAVTSSTTAGARRLERTADCFAGSPECVGIFDCREAPPAVGRAVGARLSSSVAIRFGARGMSRRVVRATLNLRRPPSHRDGRSLRLAAVTARLSPERVVVGREPWIPRHRPPFLFSPWGSSRAP